MEVLVSNGSLDFDYVFNLLGLNIVDLKDRYKTLLIKKQMIETSIDKNEKELSKRQVDLNNLKLAHEALLFAAKLTRDKFRNQVSSLVNPVLKSVFRNRNFEFDFDFYYNNRGQIEAQPIIKEGDSIFIPKEELGGSTLNIIGLMFRPIFHSLEPENSRSRPVFFLDEPAHFSDKDVTEEIGQILQKLKDRYQFVICTHNWDLVPYGDKVFRVEHDGIESKVSIVR